MLTTEEMQVLAETFQDSFKFMMTNAIGETKKRYTEFSARLVLQEKPYLLVTEEGLQHISGLVFSTPEIRDFILGLSFVFFSRQGFKEGQMDDLARALARGTSSHEYITNEEQRLDAIPKAIGSRMLSFNDVFPLLKANRWLMIVLLIQLFINVDVTEHTKQKKP